MKWVVKCWINEFGDNWISQESEFGTEQEAIEFAETEEKIHNGVIWDKVTIEEI